jgi:hypothetical protein
MRAPWMLVALIVLEWFYACRLAPTGWRSLYSVCRLESDAALVCFPFELSNVVGTLMVSAAADGCGFACGQSYSLALFGFSCRARVRVSFQL